MITEATIEKEKKIWALLQEVYDPEVPVLTVLDLGIVRDIKFNDEEIEVVITPTYSGCPAMDVISTNIRFKPMENGYKKVRITQVLSPAWTTDWMSEAGRQKLKEYGIAPPNPRQQVCRDELFSVDEGVQCPHCISWNTRR